MTTHDVRHQLLEYFHELLDSAPQLRLGQLLCNLTTMACAEDAIKSPWESRDMELIPVASSHLAARQDAPPLGEPAASLEVRTSLFEALAELSDLAPEVSIAMLISHLAFVARAPMVAAIWDVEDDELLRAAQYQLQRHRERMILEGEARAAIAAYSLRQPTPLLQTAAN